MLTYSAAERTMRNARNGRRKLANNTYLYQRGDGYAVRLHSTDVVRIHRDGTYTLNTGGWDTVTTKQRINAWSPARVYSERGTWAVCHASDPRTGPKIRACRSCKGTGSLYLTEGYRDTWHPEIIWENTYPHTHKIEDISYPHMMKIPVYEDDPTCTCVMECTPPVKTSIRDCLKHTYAAEVRAALTPVRYEEIPDTSRPVTTIRELTDYTRVVKVFKEVIRRPDGWGPLPEPLPMPCWNCDSTGQRDYGSKPQPWEFFDGITVDGDGQVINGERRLNEGKP